MEKIVSGIANVPLCKDCMFAEQIDSRLFCARPFEPDYEVGGKFLRLNVPAQDERSEFRSMNITGRKCGPQAAFFLAKT